MVSTQLKEKNMIRNNIAIENAHIGFRNFSGKQTPYNAAGKRNFCVFLDLEIAKALEADGWNVRWLTPKDDQEESQPYLQAAVNYNHMPPKIVLITSTGKTILDEDSVSLLDWADIREVDLILNPYNWVVQEGTKNEKRGVKAYVKAMYVTIAEDPFEAKYYEAPNRPVDLDDEQPSV